MFSCFYLTAPECLMDSNNIFANVAPGLHFVLLCVLGCLSNQISNIWESITSPRGTLVCGWWSNIFQWSYFPNVESSSSEAQKHFSVPWWAPDRVSRCVSWAAVRHQCETSGHWNVSVRFVHECVCFCVHVKVREQSAHACRVEYIRPCILCTCLAFINTEVVCGIMSNISVFFKFFQGEPGFLGPQGEPGLPGLPGTKVGWPQLVVMTMTALTGF